MRSKLSSYLFTIFRRFRIGNSPQKTSSSDHPKASLIIAVYNHADFLEKVLLSLSRQSEKEFEIIVADDGSGDEIKEMIAKYNSLSSSQFAYPIKHAWHEDDGFRKTIIANSAVMMSDSEYLIFIDGDCILHHKFVERHIVRAKVNHVQTGRRVMLSDEASKKMTNEDISSGLIESPSYWKRSMDVREANTKYGYYKPLFYKFFNLTHSGYRIIGCNFSIHKTDFMAINGYDQRVIGRGLEDTNLNNRLIMVGTRVDYIAQEAIQYHLHHSFEPIPHSDEVVDQFTNPANAWSETGMVQK